MKQPTSISCKSTAAALSFNLIRGSNSWSSSDMGLSSCKNLDGDTVKGSNGKKYRVTYKQDSYVGSKSELQKKIDKAISSSLPIVVPVHSSSIDHHWVVLVGKSGNDYLILDVLRSGSGTCKSQAKKMSSYGYSFGLADYSKMHYGYISFSAA